MLLSGNGRLFTAGIDLGESFVTMAAEGNPEGTAPEHGAGMVRSVQRPDVARAALKSLSGIKATQALFNAIEECRVPVRRLVSGSAGQRANCGVHTLSGGTVCECLACFHVFMCGWLHGWLRAPGGSVCAPGLPRGGSRHGLRRGHPALHG